MKVAMDYVFSLNRGSAGSKSRLARAAGAEPVDQMKDEKYIRRCGTQHIWK